MIKSYQIAHVFPSLTNQNCAKLEFKVFPCFFFFGLFIDFLTGSMSCGYHYDSQAFLFSLVNKPGWAPVKLPQYRYYQYAIHSHCSYYGPIFGGGNDIAIYDHASSSSSNYANLGYTYRPPNGYSYGNTFTQTFLAGGNNYYFTPDEVEIFYETT